MQAQNMICLMCKAAFKTFVCCSSCRKTLLNFSKGTKGNSRLAKLRMMHNSANKHAVWNPLNMTTYTYPASDTHTQRAFTHALNTGYCNWNKVQRDYDLTPSSPVILILHHSHSFFSSLPSLSPALPPLTDSSARSECCRPPRRRTNTHLASQCFFLSLAILPPHFVSKDSTREPLAHRRTHVRLHFLFCPFSNSWKWFPDFLYEARSHTHSCIHHLLRQL